MRTQAERDPWLDNARLVAAVGVVLGHCIGSVLANVTAAEPLWAATWAFRLPALVLLAGVFSRSEPLTRASFGRLVRTVLVVYVVFDALFVIVHGLLVRGTESKVLVPEWGLWFLLSLFCWRLALPLLARVPHLFWWSVAAAVGAGFVPVVDGVLSLSRTVVWFPVFLLGHRLGQADARAWMARVKVSTRLRVTACIGLALAATTCLLVGHFAGLVALRFEGPYTGGLAAQVGQAALRGALLAAAALGVFALLVLVPRGRIRGITVLGAGSLSIYLMHSLLLPVVREWGAFSWVDSLPELLVMLVLATGAAVLLGTPFVRQAIRPLTDPLRPAPARSPEETPAVQPGVLTSV